MANEDQRTHAAPDGPSESFRVRAVTISVRGTPEEKRVRVESPRFVIGSSESADLRISDKTVSREHLTLTLGPTGILIRDDGSRNGTWIGTTRVREVLLTADTLIKIGATTLAFQIDSGLSDIPIASRTQFGTAFGASPAMRHVFGVLERAAPEDITVLLEGESGVGKEVLARAIHDESARKNGPFVPVDCGAIPPGLIESELFGHVKGAFTGASSDQIGMVEQANGGTLFLDEIGELPLDLQPKLLRVLEAREVKPVGGREARKVNVRILAATNRKLAEQVETGEFRQDLFYRLAVVRVMVPPLRDRADDIETLATRMFQRALKNDQAAISADVIAMLKSYRWPGNVRELRNVVERHALLGLNDREGLFDGSTPETRGMRAELWSMGFHDARRALLDEFEKNYLTRVLERAGGVVARAAEMAGLARPSFYRMSDRLGIKTKDD